MKNSVIILIGILIAGGLTVFLKNEKQETLGEPLQEKQEAEGIEIIARNLHVPWNIVFLPDGDIVVTERSGVVRIIGKNPVQIEIPEVTERGEGGLLGLALHPRYEDNQYLYLYYTRQKAGKTVNAVVRYVFDAGALRHATIILDDIPGGQNHNGGRMAFGPDGMLYVTTGDAGQENLAQNTKSLAGKILRVNDDGRVPQDNPFGNAVYSYGHRNPQGLAWDTAGNLWETEHGRSGIKSGYDEINRIEKGANYGWPAIEGDETQQGMKTPLIHSGPTTTWAPGGIAYQDGALYFAGLRGQALYEVSISSLGELGEVQEHFKNRYGRLRAVAPGPDENLYVTTSNTDGRGNPSVQDDILIKLPVSLIP